MAVCFCFQQVAGKVGCYCKCSGVITLATLKCKKTVDDYDRLYRGAFVSLLSCLSFFNHVLLIKERTRILSRALLIPPARICAPQ